MAESSQSENILPERLHRNRKPKGQQGCALMLGIVMTAVAAVGAVLLQGIEVENLWLYYAMSAGGGLFGLLLLWSSFVQKMTSGIPPAVVEISMSPLVSRSNAKICVRQPGPASLKTLRANLICLRREKKQIIAQAKVGETGRSKTWVDTQVYDENLIDVYQVQPAAGDEWIEQAEFFVPADGPLSTTEKDLQIAWRIEVWVRVGFGLGVMHSFDVDVVAEGD